MSAQDNANKALDDQTKALLDLPGHGPTLGQDTLKLLHMITHGADYIITHPLESVGNALSTLAALLTGNGRAANNASARLIGWAQNNPIKALRAYVNRWVTFLASSINAIEAQLVRDFPRYLKAAESYAARLVGVERRQRQKALRREHAAMLAHVRAALQTVQREAASGYSAADRQRQPVIDRVAADIVTRLPVVRELVGKIVTGAIDLAEIDDPLIRFVVVKALGELVSHLGIERPLGALLESLLAPLLRDGRPRDLHDVIEALGSRLTAVEGMWATFMHDGGPEILQAGEEWKGLTSATTDALLLGFFAQEALDPDAWAAEISDTLGALVADTMTGVSDMIRAL